MSEWLIAGLLLIGSAFMLLAAIGVLRMPDLYIRLQATSKAATLGVGGILLAVAIHADSLAISLRAGLGVAFFFITIPVSAHLLARAAYAAGVPLWEGTRLDEMRPPSPSRAEATTAERRARSTGEQPPT